ncbi:uncharacterized protein LOC119666584 [Teleopsis dalmanni]|uniref:uncharacterized protein LOC119666584 n=1 Tax=Teleopsis dalmanni TaxID=139649 RepID=UPI0018CCB705|nr:uncharacterized protein LOC119666584 [Teleopsis dalmanni]
MDDNSRQLVNDCFLRPISDPKTTNTPNNVTHSAPTLKTELQVVRLSDESHKITMETLRFIHGNNFRLDDISKYKDRGGRQKKSYWEDRGTLMVQSITNYSNVSSKDTNEDRLRRFALLKLENYGYAASHCVEAYDHCKGDTDAALLLLFSKYMRIPDKSLSENEILPDDITEEELLTLRAEEKDVLESIYENAFVEKERNVIWSLQFKINYLLSYSPSELKKTKESINKPTKPVNDNGLKRCRNFDKDGTCRFGNNCRFAHVKKETEKEKTTKAVLDENENEHWFFLEVRFPPDTKYPYEAPYIYVKTTCHDIPRDILLRLSRHLYNTARDICRDGMSCVYTVCEQLQTEETILKFLDEDREIFLNADKSIFYVEDEESIMNKQEEVIKSLPTHYERGETAYNDHFQRNAMQLEKDNRSLIRRFLDRQNDETYLKMMFARKNLPAFTKMMEILNMIENNQVVVISGETGCGKSTQVPQFILDNWMYTSSKLDKSKPVPHVEIICTQPRRLSAIGVAERVSNERIERVGQSIGYQIRLENKISPSTRLTFCTTGILLRRLMSDPLLDTITHIIVDEVHERSEESDFLLMILKNLLKERQDLKVILMSATLNAKLFSEYFGNAPVLDIPGRTFPVEQLFLEDILELSDYVIECDSQYSRKIQKKEEEELMQELEYADVKSVKVAPPKNHKDENLSLSAIYARYNDYSKKTCKSIFLMEPMKINPELIEAILKFFVEGEHSWPKEGSILIFLPGLQEIQLVFDSLMDSTLFGPRSNKFVIIPLHSTLTSEEQSAIFRPAPKGKRKIVLSTNIAETSVTIDDCVFVIDSGLMKEKRFDSNRNMESLDLVWVSRANAMQRKGRAGRVMPGVCVHLFTGHRFHHNILSQPVPEIHRVPLEQLVLRIKTLPNFNELNVLTVLGQTLEPPTEENIISAVNRLEAVGALDSEQNLTPLGHHLSQLPVDVRIGKLMLYGAIFHCLDNVLTIAACLSHKSPFVSPFNKRNEAQNRKRSFSVSNSDHLTCLMAYNKWLDVSKRSYLASRHFADENFLSLKTLQTISEVKYQFLELLISIGFVPINLPRRRKNADDNILQLTGQDLNTNGGNNRLLVSLLCAALYPNIVKILTPERSYIQTVGGAFPKPATAKELRFKTHGDGFVSIHPSSVNSDIGTFQWPFLIYQEKVKTSKIFVRECTMLPLVPLVLFSGSDIKIELHGGDFLFSIENGWVLLKAYNHETAEIIQCLRIELFKLLEEKIRDPCLNLLNHENGRKIINNIVYLFRFRVSFLPIPNATGVISFILGAEIVSCEINILTFAEMSISQKRKAGEVSQDAKRPRIEDRDWTPGKIMKINLNNFMCHSNMTLTYHPRMNFLVGANGSGKSALMTAVSVVLGAKARVTNRCDSLKNLIKTGQNSAKIEITIFNGGPEGYKTDIYGNEITIIKQITMSTSSYTIKSGNGRTISKKLDELNNIMLHHNIQVDNPIFVLNQDAAREFLRTMDESQNFKMFMKATQLDYISQKLSECRRDQINYQNRLKSLKATIEMKQKEIKNVIYTKKEIRDIILAKKDFETIIYNKENMEINFTQKKCESDQRLEQDKIICNNYLKECTEARKKVKDHREQVIEIESKIKAIKNKMDSLNTNIIQINCAISNADESNAAQKQAENTRKLEALNERLTESTRKIDEEKNKLNMYNQQKIELNEKMQEIVQKKDGMRRQLANFDINISSINKKDPLSVYSSVIPNLMKVKQRIEVLYKEGKFSAQPIGPLGIYVKVPNENLRNIIESVIRNLLKGFIVNNAEDREVLEEIFRTLSPTANIPIIQMKFMKKVYDVSNGKVECPKGTKILMHEIECKHPVVMNCLIDRQQIECILLAENNKAAEMLTSQKQNVPQNLFKIIVPSQNTEFYPAPHFRMYSLNIRKAQLIQVDVQDRINQIQNEKKSVQENIEKLSMDINHIRSEQQKLVANIAESRKIVQNSETSIDNIKEEILDLGTFELPASSNIERLKIIKSEHMQQLNSKKKELEENEKKIEGAKNELIKYEKELRENEHLLSSTQKAIEEEMVQKGELENQFRKINVLYKNSKDKYAQKNALQLKLENKTVEMTKEISELISLASQHGERIDSDESKEDVNSKIKVINAQIKSRSNITDNPEELQLKINDLIQELNDNHDIYKSFKLLVDTQQATLQHRRTVNAKITKSMFILVNFSFQQYLKSRRFSGEILFDIKNRTLKLRVTPPVTSNIEGAVDSTKSLSGGERSFTTVTFLLALWTCVDHPFIILDEYDVFTDELSREYINRLLVQECAKKRRQYTFLTPLEQNINCVNNGKIHKLSDP